MAATLFYGLTHAHAFENGNKRTALVSLLVFLERNRTLLVDVSETEIYEMSTQLGAHEFPDKKIRMRDVDLEVAAVANWISRHSRPLKRGDRRMQFSVLKSQLLDLGCEFAPPAQNFIKVYRDTRQGRRSVRLGYPRADFSVGVQDVKRVRKALLLDESSGVDSGAFYDELSAVVDLFVNRHRQVLDRLAEV